MLHVLKMTLDGQYQIANNSRNHSRAASADKPVQLASSNSAGNSLQYNALSLSPKRGTLHIPPRGLIDSDARLACEMTLEIMLHMFSWIPLTDASLFSMDLLETILLVCHLNDSLSVSVGSVGLQCMNELLTRKTVPGGMQVE